MRAWLLVAALACSFSVSAQPKRKPVAPPAPVKVLDADTLALSANVAIGRVPCELGAHVHLTRDEKNAGYFWLELGKQKFHMAPVATSTGAVRLEDSVSGAVWLQLGNKSMLMNQKLGKRLADVCVNDEQVKVAEALERNPPAGLLDDPVKPRNDAGIEKAVAEAISTTK
ncbi:MAG: hypothetical protein H7Y28_11020 [Rhodoferax sp.]|nr:hypothetical protein [Rhodoferax sp.]